MGDTSWGTQEGPSAKVGDETKKPEAEKQRPPKTQGKKTKHRVHTGGKKDRTEKQRGPACTIVASKRNLWSSCELGSKPIAKAGRRGKKHGKTCGVTMKKKKDPTGGPDRKKFQKEGGGKIENQQTTENAEPNFTQKIRRNQ